MSGRCGGCLSVCPLLALICIVASIFGQRRQRQSLATTASTFKLNKTGRGPRVVCSGVSVDTSGNRQVDTWAVSLCRLVSKTIHTYLLLPVAVDRCLLTQLSSLQANQSGWSARSSGGTVVRLCPDTNTSGDGKTIQLSGRLHCASGAAAVASSNARST